MCNCLTTTLPTTPASILHSPHFDDIKKRNWDKVDLIEYSSQCSFLLVPEDQSCVCDNHPSNTIPILFHHHHHAP